MLVVGLITLLVVSVVVALQVLALLLISDHLPRFPFRHLFKVTLGLIGVISAHVISIVIFGCVTYALTHVDKQRFGRLESEDAGTMNDYIYFSFTTYTTVGYGDYIPKGPIRLLSQIEALVGLVLIACSASYIFIIMQDYWRTHTRVLRRSASQEKDRLDE